ncbi:MAG: NAD(P)H-quinone oxidoreductase subunit 3 [Candidatus Latescibacteria bacterium]|nr:NAD(P)H-quinone oxidoreductase subunit 3 [Candidatus Latescibacterota bacterium]NIM21994.1 NAD(P)H-quinone oxidoreductase subunit 3 [Candidatus Latescibacterota bacterium]NIM66012.1 NAD(P)H-quinone oxidoreductase subunit 3 [Candidatus Latescibacterota bacterium]NIO02420.1 NAD(P)H-quinone oxidoreductase subunit 3 [Candidatus Latescibacterota bacterium]NIO29331.1 NAD(P)H-quinone oxidoreductase subunit 3 [Candidatus Latescibacterota bacterium]
MLAASKYAPVVLLFVIALAIPVLMIGIATIVGPRRLGVKKKVPFECGTEPIGDTRKRFSVRFFLVALLFIVFDVEAVFIFPWAVLFRQLGLFGFIEMAVFLFILILGLVYVWKKGALEWE